MPGTLIGTIAWPSTFNPQKDADDPCVEIRNASSTPLARLTVFFLAEKHRDPFDVKRSTVVFEAFSEQQSATANNVCLVVERGLFDDFSASNLVREGMADYSSADAKRNDLVVANVKSYRKRNPATILIFFYGEEHLEPIKERLVRDQSADTTIRWISSVSFDTAVSNLEFNERSRFQTSGREPAGYTACDPKDLNFSYLRLLTKGQWFTRFMVPLWPLDTASAMGARIFAIYFKDITKSAEVKRDVDGEGGIDYTFETFDGKAIAVALAVNKNGVPILN